MRSTLWKNVLSNFGRIMEKLEIGPYTGHDLFCTLEIIPRGKMTANWTSEKFSIKLVTWSEKLGPVFSFERYPCCFFQNPIKNITKMTKFWKKNLEFRKITRDGSPKLPEALETDFKWISSHRKASEAISKNPEISREMEPTGSQMMEIRACRYAACQNMGPPLPGLDFLTSLTARRGSRI